AMVSTKPKLLLSRCGICGHSGSWLVRSGKKSRVMSQATKAKIFDALATEFHAAGLGDFNEAMKALDESTQHVEQGFKAANLVQLKRILKGVPEPSAGDLQKTLDNIKGKLRYELRPAIVNTLQQFKKALPHKRGGGRPRALTTEQKSAACDAVALL